MTSTNVPSVTWGDNGLVVPAEVDILAGVQADWTAAFAGQGALSFTTTSGSVTNATSAGQASTSLAAVLGNVDAAFAFLATQCDPAYAMGRWQDAIGRIAFMARSPSTFTTLTVRCTGVVGVTIPFTSTIQDNQGYIYQCTAAGTIPVSGYIDLFFANTEPGPLSVPSSIAIYQSVSGWDTVSVLSGALGKNTESRSGFEYRRQQSVAANSSGMTASIQGALLALPGVTSAYTYSNDNGTTQTVQGVSLPANALYVAVAGGVSDQIAQTILTRKNPGSPYYSGDGTVTVSVEQTSGYVPPYPTYSVTYQVPIQLPILVSVSLVSSTSVPSNATSLIQTAVLASFSGSDNGQPVGIAARLLASRISQTIASPSINGVVNPYYLSWAQVLSVQLGSPNAPDAFQPSPAELSLSGRRYSIALALSCRGRLSRVGLGPHGPYHRHSPFCLKL